MTEKAAVHGESIVFIPGSKQDFWHSAQMMEASTVLRDMSPKSFRGSSGMPSAPSLRHDERLYTQQQIINVQQQTIATLSQEIRRLQQLVNSMSQELESAANAATESDEDLELDYSDMEAQARLRAPSGVNWKTASTPKSYSEIMDVRYDPDAEER